MLKETEKLHLTLLVKIQFKKLADGIIISIQETTFKIHLKDLIIISLLEIMDLHQTMVKVMVMVLEQETVLSEDKEVDSEQDSIPSKERLIVKMDL